MNRLYAILAIITYLYLLPSYAVKVEIIVNTPGSSPTEYYLGIGKFKLNNIRKLDKIVESQTGKYSLDLEPGRHRLFFRTPESTLEFYEIYIDKISKKVILDVTLPTLRLPEKLVSVEIMGDFNQWSYNSGLVNMYRDQANNRYFLPDSIKLKTKRYCFLINRKIKIFHPNLNTLRISKYGNIIHKYGGNSISFNLDVFPRGKMDEFKVNGKGLDLEYSKVAIEGMELFLENDEIIKKYYRGLNDSSQNTSELLDSYTKDFNRIYQNTVDLKASNPKYEQAFLEPLMYMLNRAPIQIEYQTLAKDDRSRTKIRQSKDYMQCSIEMGKWLTEIDIHSDLINGSFVQFVSGVSSTFKYYGLYDSLGISWGFFDDLLWKYYKTSLKLVGKDQILYDMANRIDYYRPNAAMDIYNDILEQYPKTELRSRVKTKITGMNIKKGAYAPEFQLTLIDGTKIKLSDYRGKLVFLDFWGTWCAPCRSEIPNIKKLDEKLGNHVEVIGVVCRDQFAKVEKYIKEEKLSYSNGLDERSRITKEYGVSKWPTTFLISPEGKILAKDLRGSQLIESVKPYINQN